MCMTSFDITNVTWLCHVDRSCTVKVDRSATSLSLSQASLPFSPNTVFELCPAPGMVALGSLRSCDNAEYAVMSCDVR